MKFSKQATKQETYLTKWDIKEIVKDIVFRDTQIIYEPPIGEYTIDTYSSQRYLGKVHFSRRVLYRDEDRRFINDRYKTPDHFRRITSMYDASIDFDPTKPISAYSYDMYDEEGYSKQFVGTLQGWHWIPEYITAEGFVRWVFEKIRYMEIHEMQENFYYRGERVFDPHNVGEFI